MFSSSTAIKAQPVIWTGMGKTTSGVATFYLTKDGTASGTPLISTFSSVQATAQSNTNIVINEAFVSMKGISADNTTITVNAVTATTINLLGSPTLLPAPDGTTIYLLAVGTP